MGCVSHQSRSTDVFGDPSEAFDAPIGESGLRGLSAALPVLGSVLPGLLGVVGLPGRLPGLPISPTSPLQSC